MNSTHPARRASLCVLTLLAASLVPLLGPAAPAGADEHCTSELPPSPPTQPCDDVTPPDTAIASMSPRPNDNGFTRSADMTFSFAAQVEDGDTDTMQFECRLEGPSQAHDWAECTSPKTYVGLDDTGASTYVFRVRAYDSTDRTIDYDDPLTPFENEAEVEDTDQTPVSRTWLQDTRVPNTFLFGGPYDERRQDYPMAESPTVQFRVAASEDGTLFRCSLNDRAVDCEEGIVTLKKLPPGTKQFSVRAVDRAGNLDATPASSRFFVPRDLVATDGWRTIRQGGYFAGDFLETTQVGAQVTAPGQNVRELRLIAPAGPRLGKVEVKIGNSIWRTVNLHAATYERFHVYTVRDQYDPLVSGKIRIRVKSVDKMVRIDAVSARR